MIVAMQVGTMSGRAGAAGSSGQREDDANSGRKQAFLSKAGPGRGGISEGGPMHISQSRPGTSAPGRPLKTKD